MCVGSWNCEMEFYNMSEIHFGNGKHTLWRAPGKRVLNNLNPITGQRKILKNVHFKAQTPFCFDSMNLQDYFTANFSWLRWLFITLKCFISNILKAKVPVVQTLQNIFQFLQKYCFICPKLQKLTRFGMLVSVCCPLNSRKSWYKGRKQILYNENNLSQNLQLTPENI